MALQELIRFQLDGHRGLDYKNSYPRHSFDAQSIQWDLNYFKYYYLKLANISFDEQLLEDDYRKFINLLLQAGQDFFMFRDFQSRNIMIRNEKLYFIDYQGGRKGALQYDLASLLYQAKANLPEPLREQMLEYYLDKLQKRINIDRKKFTDQYYAYVLVRTMQVLGAYGYRGFFERKSHFIDSIPYAINNLQNIFGKLNFIDNLSEIKNILQQIMKSKSETIQTEENSKLHVNILSFSYKKGLPEDNSGNGGGFIFDCRALPNPGRFDEYKTSTGKDRNVIEFLDDKMEVNNFLAGTFNLVEASVETYLSRKFTHLQVCYGCTGGQHRSVYSAEKLAGFLRKKFDVEISVKHREQEM